MIDFVGILAQMQRMVERARPDRADGVVGLIGNLAARFPEAGDRLDVYATVDDYADRAGAAAQVVIRNTSG